MVITFPSNGNIFRRYDCVLDSLPLSENNPNAENWLSATSLFKQFKQKGLQYFLSSSLASRTNIVNLLQEPNKGKR